MYSKLQFQILWFIASLAFGTRDLAAQELAGDQIAARRQLIEQAQTAREAGNHVDALNLATRAGALQMSPSLRRFIAEEEFTLSQFAAALGSAETCVRDSRAANAADHLAACESILSQSREQVGYVVITVDPSPPSLVVSVGGRAVPRALLGQRYVVNPGSVVVEVSASEYRPARAEMRIAKGQIRELSLRLEPLTRTAPAAPAPSTGEFYLSPLVPIGGGVAVTGFAVALGLGLSGQSALDDYSDRCTSSMAPPSCAAEQTELQSDLDARALGVNVAIGVAAAGLVAGTFGIFLSGVSEEQQAALWRGEILFQ